MSAPARFPTSPGGATPAPSTASTTTGQQLADRLTALAAQLVGGQIPAKIGGALSKAVTLVEGRIKRLDALAELVASINARGEMYDWALATEIEHRVKRFRPVRYKRIQSGAIAPTTDDWLLFILSQEDKCVRSIWKEIRLLKERFQKP